MRMKVCKRIGALVLALALILSGVPQMAIEALAETTGTTTSEFTVTGLGSETSILSNGTWRIYLNYTGTFDAGAVWGGDFLTWLSYSINDGTSQSAYGVQFYQANTATKNSAFALHIPSGVVPSDGTADLKFVIKANSWTKGSHSYTMKNDLVLYFNEYGVFFGEEKIVKEELQDVYITEIGHPTERNYIYPKMSEEDMFEQGDYPLAAVGYVGDSWYYPDNENGIWLDGKWLYGTSTIPDGGIEFIKATDWAGRYRLHPAWYFDGGTGQSSQPIAYGERITLKGLFVSGEKSFNILNSVIEWHASTGVGTSSSTGEWILLPRLLELQEGTTVNNGQWEIHMNYAGKLVGTDGETFTGKAVVGDEEIDVTISTDGTNIIITPPADKVPTDGTTVTMTLKAGDITGSARSKSMIVNDVTFYINQHGLSLDAPIPETEEEYITKIHDVPATNSSSVYFEMSAVDAFGEQMIVGDEADIKPHAMSGVMDGAYYHESGVWIGDTRYAVDSGESPRLVKSDAIRDGNQKDYYIPFWSVSSKIVDGVKVRVKGLFGADGKFANIAESVMQYNATEDDWILLPRLLDMAKGAEKVDNQWKIYMNYVGTLAGQEEEKFTATAYMEDDSTCDVQIYVEGDYLVLVPDAAALPTDGTEATITLKAGDISGDKNSKSYIVNDVTLCANQYGVSLDELIPSYTIVENKLDPMTTYKEETEGSYVWDIYMKQSGSFLGGEGEVFKWPATIAGEDGTVDVYAKNVNGIIYFNPVIPDSDVLKPANGKVEVVLKAVAVTGTKGTQNELKEAVTLYFDRNGLSVDDSALEDVQMPTESMKLKLTTPKDINTGIYLTTSIEGNIVGDNWGEKPVAIGGYKNGVCYRGDSGIYVTDVDGNTTKFMPNTGSNPSLFKLGIRSKPYEYYIGNLGKQNIEKGMKVTIQGVFEWDGKYDSIAPTTLEWDGAQWINVTPADDKNVELTLRADSGTCTRIYVDGVDGINPNKTDNEYNTPFVDPMPGEDNGVFFNGVRTDVQLYKMGQPYGNGVYHVVLDGQKITAEAGDEVVIKGRFTSNGHIVEYKEVCFIFDGSKWVKATVATRVNLVDADREDAISFGFTTDIEDALAQSNTEIKNFTVGGIYVNGKYNAAAYLYKLEDGYYKVDLSGCAMTFVQGDTVTVDGTVEEGNVLVEFMRTVFTYQGNGVWTLTESGIPKQPVRFELSADESYKADNGDWKLLFTAADGLRGDPGVEADATYSGLVALVNGVPKAEPTFFKNSKSYYEVTIPGGALPETGDTYEIVIKRGTLTGGWEAETGRYMQKEITLYISGERISDKGTPTGTKGVKLSYASGDAKAVNFLLGSEDSMIVTTKNGGTIVAENEPNSGVFINGVKQTNTGLFKFEENASTYYYVPFDTNTYKPKMGDVVVVNGTFEMANYYVTFDTVAMKWNGSAWEGIVDLTSIALNDVEFDASDDAFLIETTGTTVNGNNVDAGAVLYEEGEYSIVYTIGTAVMTQKLNIIYKFTSAGNNGAGKSDTTLPTDMVTGNANAADQYITQVQATTHGTTVISMDRENAYKTTADFDDYGLDYVVDINMDSDREFKVLQLADTQTLNSEQQRYSGRISPTLAAQTVPEKQFENMQYYIDKVVAESKPDVILIAGDLIYTEFDDDGSMWIDLIEYMDSLQIPWAPIFGNHDQESKMGVEWQCAQMMNSTYCLFNRRHEGVGGNCNYSIGLARNGKLEKAIYMFDSNGCGNVDPSGNTYSTWGYDDNGNMTEVRAASGFYQTQIEWYKKAAMRVNAAAGEIIPSIQCYHIGTEEVILAARAAGYQYGDEQAGNTYAMSDDPNAETYLANGNVNSIVRPQTGDLGYKMGYYSDTREAKGMLEIMNAVGTTGVFLGHNHKINTSMTYGGVRWTYGLKTGIYAADTVKKGGTLITMKNDSDSFDIRHIYVELEYSEPSLDADKAAENNASTIYLNGNVVRDAMAVQADALVVSKDAESGIFVNAVKSNATLEKYAEDKYKITLSADAKVGDVVSIYGIFDNNAGTHGVYFQKTLAVKWDGTQWIAIKLDWLNGSTVSLGTVVVDYSKVASYKLDAGVLPTRVDAEGKKTDAPLTGVTTYGESTLKYILDNVTYEKKVVLYNPGDVHVDEELNVLDLVAMKKVEGGEEAESLTESYAAQLGSDDLRKRLVAAETNKLIVTGVNKQTAIYNGGKHWRVYLDYKGYEGAPCNFSLGGNWKNPFTYLQYSVDGGQTASSYSTQFYSADGKIVLQFTSSIVPTDGTAKTKLTIKAFTDKSSGSGSYVYSLMEDFTLYFDGTTVSLLP